MSKRKHIIDDRGVLVPYPKEMFNVCIKVGEVTSSYETLEHDFMNLVINNSNVSNINEFPNIENQTKDKQVKGGVVYG